MSCNVCRHWDIKLLDASHVLLSYWKKLDFLGRWLFKTFGFGLLMILEILTKDDFILIIWWLYPFSYSLSYIPLFNWIHHSFSLTDSARALQFSNMTAWKSLYDWMCELTDAGPGICWSDVRWRLCHGLRCRWSVVLCQHNVSIDYFLSSYHTNAKHGSKVYLNKIK